MAQLASLRGFLQSNANSAGWLPWLDTAPAAYSRTSGQRLHVNTVNLYQACLCCALSLYMSMAWRCSGVRVGG